MKYSIIFLSAVMAGVVTALPIARGTAHIDDQGCQLRNSALQQKSGWHCFTSLGPSLKKEESVKRLASDETQSNALGLSQLELSILSLLLGTTTEQLRTQIEIAAGAAQNAGGDVAGFADTFDSFNYIIGNLGAFIQALGGDLKETTKRSPFSSLSSNPNATSNALDLSDLELGILSLILGTTKEQLRAQIEIAAGAAQNAGGDVAGFADTFDSFKYIIGNLGAFVQALGGDLKSTTKREAASLFS